MDRKTQLKAWLKKQPKDAFLRYALATEYIAEGKDIDAEDIFKALIADEPKYYATYYHYGQLLERKNDTENAQLIYEQGIAICQASKETFAQRELQAALDELLFE